MQPTVIPSARTEVFVFGLESADVLLDSEGDTATKVSRALTVVLGSVVLADNISINLFGHFFNSRAFPLAVTCDGGCWNGGECFAVNGVAKCICPSSWSGSKCQEGVFASPVR